MQPVRFSTADGVSLEGELRPPEGPPRGSAVICHAHPRHGGTKDHPILWAVRNELARRGLAVLAFNFRGTMGSGGTHGGGRTEVLDVEAALERVRAEAAGPTLVVGWSFGANVALRAALVDDRVAGLALVGLPLEHDLDIPPTPDPAELCAFRRPVLLVAGEHDPYASPAALERLAAALPSAQTQILPGTDHYLWRREREAAERIGAFAESLLG
jgi:hypothetical protein